MLIAFIHNNKAFLPEITAYAAYFSAKGIRCEAATPAQLAQLRPDVAWFFMGYDRQPKPAGVVTIHEYVSASVPPVAKLKNTVKRALNRTPDYRLFLNEFVKDAFFFSDGVPFGYRDMGVPSSWLHKPLQPAQKQYDFIYVGECRNRDMNALLDVFANGKLKQRSLLVVSRDYEAIRNRYSAAGNIIFEGPVEHEQVPDFIHRARFAINFMPDEVPYNRQTSTKFLEYAACGLPIISSDYYWMREFQRQYGGEYFYLRSDLFNLSWENVSSFNYASPNMHEWTWEKQIDRSGIMDFLQRKFS